MRSLAFNEIALVSGGEGSATWGLAHISFTAIGGYLGSYVAYIEPLMDANSGMLPSGQFGVMYTPSYAVLVPSIIVGAIIGLAMSEAARQFIEKLSA